MRSYNVNMHDANAMMESLMCCYAYDACMHDTRNIKMKCYVQKCLINHALLPKYVQNLEDNERKKRILT